MAAIAFLIATFAHAQDSQFLFDPNGNLLVETAEIAARPQILGQPQNVFVAPGEAASFFVVAADTRALAYAWRFNSVPIGGSATNDALLLQNVSTNNEGQYSVVLTNPSGSVTSAPALLMIDSDADGVPDSWELTFFGNLTNSATTDFDGDGSSNLQEYLNGTDPANSNSVRFQLTVVLDGGSVLKSPDQASYTNGQSVTLTATASSNETFHAWLGDVVTRSNPVTVVMTNNKTVHARFTPIVFGWTNGASSDWNFATNWEPNLVPGSNDSVVISIGNTITLNTPADCADFTLGNTVTAPTLTGSATLTIRGNFLWMQGAMSGSGRTVIEAGATLNVANASAQGVLLTTRALENGGTVFWSGSGNIALNSGAVITNRAGALVDVQNAASLVPNVGVGRFDNAGTFRKSVSTGTTTVSSGIGFNNFGTVEIQTGTLLCNGGFTNQGAITLSGGTTNRLTAGGSGTGVFTTPAAALVEWTGGTFTLNPGAQLSGSGLYKLNGGSLNADVPLTVENLDVVSGGSTWGGSGSLTIASTMNWTAGNMTGSGRTIVPTGATLNIPNPSGVILTTRTLDNGGTVLWTGAGSFALNSGATVTNRAGALFDIQTASSLQPNVGVGRFDNAGTVRKSVNTGTATVASGVSFNNSGTVEIQTGMLLCNGGFTNNGTVTLSADTTNRIAASGSATGTFTAPATALVEWTGGTFTLNQGAQLNGNGLYKLNGGAVTRDASLTVENLDIVHGGSTLGGTGAVTVASAMNWTAGSMGVGGRTIIPAGATLSIPNPSGVLLNTRTLENAGTVLWTGAGSIALNSSAVITNRAGALFHAQNAASFVANVGVGRIDNVGTFRKSISSGTITVGSGVSFNNFGTMDIRSGKLAANGGYVSSSNALLNCTLGGTVAGTNYGQLQISGTATLNGSLSVDLTNGFSPSLNDSFSVLTAGTRNGTFNNFFYPSNQLLMQLSNTVNSAIVRVSGLVIPRPTLLTPVLSGSNVLVTWTSVSNATYRLEFNPDLALSNWNTVPGDIVGSSNTASKLDTLTPSNRFYRVRILP
jgi:hypothetical protein